MFESLNALAYTPFLGKPLLMWGGATMLILILSTGLTTYLYSKKVAAPLTYKLHKLFGTLTILTGLFHGLLGFSKYLM
jgi:hypothetical protein